MKKIALFFLTFPFSLFGWTHLELGAGNYGEDGHTQTSQQKTVLMALSFVSEKENYIDFLEKTGAEYDPQDQYAVLFWTLDKLVERYGDEGTFYVNDLYPDYAEYAAMQLAVYAQQQGYHQINVETLSGDYQTLEGRTFDSVHLKNPEISLFYEGIDGDEFLTSHKKIQKTRELLSKLATLSDEGLYLFIIDSFLPDEEKVFGEFYWKTEDWEPVPYVYPEGIRVDPVFCSVYLIK